MLDFQLSQSVSAYYTQIPYNIRKDRSDLYIMVVNI